MGTIASRLLKCSEIMESQILQGASSSWYAFLRLNSPATNRWSTLELHDVNKRISTVTIEKSKGSAGSARGNAKMI
jgi:hypothetical protein